MKTRAKFHVLKVSEFGYNGKRWDMTRDTQVLANSPSPVDGSVDVHDRSISVSTELPVREITLQAVCGGSAENESFAKYTPQGTITITVDNEHLGEEFKPGMSYYVDFTPTGE